MLNESSNTASSEPADATDTWKSTSEPLARANAQVLARLKYIDAMAAERGLEVGGAGGDRTALARVERAANSSVIDGKGILGLLEGSGLLDSDPALHDMSMSKETCS